MARITRNEVMHGASGKLGDLVVFKQVNGKTIITRSPLKSSSSTEGQQGVRQKFKDAARYGKSVLNDAALKKLYAERALPGQTAFHVAFADFFKAPEIHGIDAGGYLGVAGNVVKTQVSDNFLVKQVEVTITGADNTLLEKGTAIMDADGLNWTYTATQANGAVAGTRMTVSAIDLPGNLTVFEKVLG